MKPNICLPFRYEKLPQELRSLVSQAVESEFYKEAIDAIEIYIDEHGTNNPDVLAALALCLFEDALTVMVDEVIPVGERALTLLKNARELKFPAEIVKKFQAKVKRIVDREKKRQTEILSLIERPIETLNFQQVKDLAYLMSEKKGQRNAEYAARLFTIAAQKAEHMGQEPNYFRCRSALSLAQAKCWVEALPKLRDIVEGKVTISLDNSNLDQSYILLAFYCLFDYYIEQNDRRGFEQLWHQAHQAMNYFPVAWRVQDQLLRVAYEWKILHICEHLLELILFVRSPRQISLETKELIEEIQAYIEREHRGDTG